MHFLKVFQLQKKTRRVNPALQNIHIEQMDAPLPQSVCTYNCGHRIRHALIVFISVAASVGNLTRELMWWSCVRGRSIHSCENCRTRPPFTTPGFWMDNLVLFQRIIQISGPEMVILTGLV